jgi:poly-gamma-glutamate synthesis protein (capsule biosynthesis protein)
MNIMGRKRNQIRIITIVVIGVFLISASFGGWWYMARYNKSPSIAGKKVTTQVQTKTVKELPKQNPTIHMAAMGDMLAHDTIIANATTETSYNFKHFFNNIRSSYSNADVVFCDQEGLSSGETYGISGYPSFNAPTQFAADLQSGAGCNLINLANNHMGDKGVAATNATIDVWDALKPLAINGANKSADDQERVSYATVNGIKIGFVSFADFNNNKATPDYSVNIYHDEALVRRLVTAARANSDVVIVSMHWGVEDSNTVSSDQQNEANLLSSLGVDVIIGTGPHVLQKVQTITRDDGGKTVVWYSLGNMLSSQLNIDELIGGIAQFDVVKNSDNKISINNLSFTPTYMHYEWTASQAASGDLLARHNAMIYLLSAAADPLSRSLFNTTVAVQKQYVIDTLGSEVTVK